MSSILKNTSRVYRKAYKRTHDREFLGRSELLEAEARLAAGGGGGGRGKKNGTRREFGNPKVMSRRWVN